MRHPRDLSPRICRVGFREPLVPSVRGSLSFGRSLSTEAGATANCLLTCDRVRCWRCEAPLLIVRTNSKLLDALCSWHSREIQVKAVSGIASDHLTTAGYAPNGRTACDSQPARLSYRVVRRAARVHRPCRVHRRRFNRRFTRARKNRARTDGAASRMDRRLDRSCRTRAASLRWAVTRAGAAGLVKPTSSSALDRLHSLLRLRSSVRPAPVRSAEAADSRCSRFARCRRRCARYVRTHPCLDVIRLPQRYRSADAAPRSVMKLEQVLAAPR